MAKYTLLLLIIIVNTFVAKAQHDNIYDLFRNFESLYRSGDLINAENIMLKVLDEKHSLPDDLIIAAYNNLSVINNLLGKYEESLKFNNQAEYLNKKGELSPQKLASIYINKARTFNLQKLHSLSIEYLDKVIRIYQDIDAPDTESLMQLSAAYQNLGVSYYKINDFGNSIKYLEKSINIKLKYSLSSLALSYLNLANNFVSIKNTERAEKYFVKSQNEFILEYGDEFFRLVDVYIDYALFLRSTSRPQESLLYLNKALDLGQKNYGTKHPDVSLTYRHIGEHYLQMSDYPQSLQYYQKSIIALVSGFDPVDIYTNPSPDSSLLDIELLKVLRKKSEGLELYAQSLMSDSLQYLYVMEKSLVTIELALQLIDKVRSEYMSEESRLYLMENEKETYFTAAGISHKLLIMTGDPGYIEKMYHVARLAKSSILRDAIRINEFLGSAGSLPDTLTDNYNDLLANLSAYNYLIHEEVKKAKPETHKIDFWKDAVFEMNREKEQFESKINTLFPQYGILLKKTEPVSLGDIRENLMRDETLVEYFLSNEYHLKGRALYIFTVTRDDLYFHRTFLDSGFFFDLETIINETAPFGMLKDPMQAYEEYTSALHRMYLTLADTAIGHLKPGRLIIIPDEEINYLPFDAFIKTKPANKSINYQELDYLIKDFAVSYGYSSSLVFNRTKKRSMENKVYAFSPAYLNNAARSPIQNEFLAGAESEIRAINKWFPCEIYSGENASESAFKMALENRGIFHLAMHSLSDTTDSKYSYLIFDTRHDTLEDGKLHHYEISLNRIQSPMIVLSSCNTGTGDLYYGEGIMSLSRAFILAGAESVVKTFWDINDEISTEIMSAYYSHLSKGKEKDEAMRSAKIEYLSNTHPSFAKPYYWAAYQVIGDTSAVGNRNYLKVRGGIGIILLFAAASSGLYYFRRRRSFFALSL